MAGQGVCVQERRPLKWAIRILLECILVLTFVVEGAAKLREHVFLASLLTVPQSADRNLQRDAYHNMTGDTNDE